MPTATQMLNEARSQVGYREGKNNDNKYGIWYGMNHQPYCAIALTWCAARVPGMLTIMGGRWSFCPSWANWFRLRGQFYTSNGQRGDIVFFDWSGQKRRGHEAHVAVAEKFEGNYVYTIEFNTVGGAGNQSDGGGVYKRKRHISTIVGYGRPKYTRETNVQPVSARPVTKYNSVTITPLVIDGVWGPVTTRRLQMEMNIPQTGKMNSTTFNALARWLRQKPVNGWSIYIKTALQHRVGVSADGKIGPETVRALQRYLNRSI